MEVRRGGKADRKANMSEIFLQDSKALEANLRETRVAKIEVDPKYQVLLDAVANYRGVKSAADNLLFELHHPYKNWGAVIQELRSFSLKSFTTYARPPKGVEACSVLLETFLDLIRSAPKSRFRTMAVDGLMAFMEKIVKSSDRELLAGLAPVIARILADLATVDQEMRKDVLSAVSTSFHPLSRLIRLLDNRLASLELPEDLLARLWQGTGALLLEIRKATYEYWLDIEGPQDWLKSALKQYDLWIEPTDFNMIMDLLEPVSHARIREYLEQLQVLSQGTMDRDTVLHLASLPGHMDIVREYKRIARVLGNISCKLSFESKSGRDVEGISIHLLFLFRMVEMDGLSHIHEEVLRQINRHLLCLVKTADFEELRRVIPKSFNLLKQQVGNHPRTALQCINALGAEILQRDNERLVEMFLEEVVAFGFQPPGIQGVDTEWHVLSNPAHLQNIRVWLDLVTRNPKVCSTLLSALTINLQLAGTCIKDTDLFQRDITKLLNSDVSQIFNLVKQFARVVPVYFNEIGAEGLLRDVSTELDEISSRRDILIHFLRKQSHVESNNLIVGFIEAIFCFWYGKDTAGLSSYIPKELLSRIPLSGRYVDHVHKIVQYLARSLEMEPFYRCLDLLLNLPEERIYRIIDEVEDVPEQERRRVKLLVKMYRLEYLKYHLGVQELRYHLEEARKLGFEGVDQVLQVLDSSDSERALEVLLDELDRLKEVILSTEVFEAQESIYYKRHIAADIPSMYGKYHEKKFDALGLTFRIENLANIHFENIIAELDVPLITRASFVTILRYLKLLWRAVRLNGVNSKKFATYLTLLEKSLGVRRFSFTQYLDIVKGLSEGVKDMIYVYYLSPHQDNLNKIIRQLWPDKLLPKYRAGLEPDAPADQVIHQVSEKFLRELISSTFGLQHLDNFVSRVYQILREQREHLTIKELDMLLAYDPGHDLCPIYDPSPHTYNLIHLGNKGYNLALLAEEGLPVPPGVIITTEVFRYYSLFQKLPGAYTNFKREVWDGIRMIEKRSGARFGDPENPLLLSVRSGAAISMPGMMSTIINVGINQQVVEGLARKFGNPWFAWDNYRRFVQSWGMSLGMEREIFTALMNVKKRKYGVAKKADFTGNQMRELALDYFNAVVGNGIGIPSDPFKQVMGSIRLVLQSWDSDKARAYREIMEISDNWGTAVIVQAMSYGNISENSGTGVVFTANPHKKLDRVCLWGDYSIGNQGEDIVSGLVATSPISVEQAEETGLEPDDTLERRFPGVYDSLLNWARFLIFEKGWTPQEIEFTFEGSTGDKLHILQTRDMLTKKRHKVSRFVRTPGLDSSYVGRGIGVSGGALTGKAVFTLDEIQELRRREPGTTLILVRQDTVPDDIKEISAADGILTARGGQTSHASIVAFRLDKTCVVGCEQLKVYELDGRALINGHEICSGDYISIDGKNGWVYLGRHEIIMEEEAMFVV